MSDKKAWYEDESFWDDTQSILFNKNRIENTLVEIDRILELVPIKPEHKILDLCCGVGRHSHELARRGFDVVGVDRKEKYLEDARSIARDEGLNIEFIREDMRKFCRPDNFDVVLNMYTSFGYFEDEAEDVQVVQNISRSLREGGCFFMESMSKEVLAHIFSERSWVEVEGKFMLEERKIEDNWGRIRSRWIIFDGDKRMEHELTIRLYSATEMRKLLLRNGFKTVDFFGNLKGDPYDHTAQRLIVLAKK